jgi:glycerophosphoryl diester phosphodiesterase
MKRILLFAFAAAALLCSCTGNDHPRILVHRGLVSEGDRFVTDENTLDALRRAQEHRDIGAVEFDVHMTRDSQLVIRHDNRIDAGLSCQGSTLEEIKAYTLPHGNKIPTLHEWLVQARETPWLRQALEIKVQKTQELENAMIRKCIDEIHALGMDDQVTFVSFSVEGLKEVLLIFPEADVVLNSSSLHDSMPPEEVKANGFTGVSYNMSVILNHPEWIGQFRDLGIETYLWMVNSTYMRGIAEDLGFNWITTDFYDIVKY